MENRKEQIVQLRKKAGLTELLRRSGGTTPRLFRSKTKNLQEDGIPDGEYKGKQLLDTKRFLSINWDVTRNRFCFAGDERKLAELMEKLQLRYEKGHPKEGEVIPSNTAGMQITMFKSPFFRHSAFKDKYFFEEGRSNLNLKDPVQEVLWLAHLDDPRVHNTSTTKRISKTQMAGMQIEAVTPSVESRKKVKSAERTAHAIGLLNNIQDDADRMHAIASIMALSAYHEGMESKPLFVLLMEAGALLEGEVSKKYGGKTAQARFIELAEMNPADLNVLSHVTNGIRTGIIRRISNGYMFNGIELEGINNEYVLGKYFLEPNNQAHFLELQSLLADHKK